MKIALWKYLFGLTLVTLPYVSVAGSLEPSAPPAPTMQSLDHMQPAWDQKLPADDTGDPCNSARFKCVLDSQGVLDKETGLVWMRYPYITARKWEVALRSCSYERIGFRLGWRLPTLEELETLIDVSAIDATKTVPALPNGNPFGGISYDIYWTSTNAINSAQPDVAWTLNLLEAMPYMATKLAPEGIWCVRGGSVVDAQ